MGVDAGYVTLIDAMFAVKYHDPLAYALEPHCECMHLESAHLPNGECAVMICACREYRHRAEAIESD